MSPGYYIDKTGILDNMSEADAEITKVGADFAPVILTAGAQAGAQAGARIANSLVKRAARRATQASAREAEQVLAREAEQVLAREAEQAMVKRAKESLARQASAREGETIVNRPVNFEDLVAAYSKKGKKGKRAP